MTRGQMKTLLAETEDWIDNFAGRNPAFDRQREEMRVELEVNGGETQFGLTPFQFHLGDHTITVVLNDDDEVVHFHRGVKRSNDGF